MASDETVKALLYTCLGLIALVITVAIYVIYLLIVRLKRQFVYHVGGEVSTVANPRATSDHVMPSNSIPGNTVDPVTSEHEGDVDSLTENLAFKNFERPVVNIIQQENGDMQFSTVLSETIEAPGSTNSSVDYNYSIYDSSKTRVSPSDEKKWKSQVVPAVPSETMGIAERSTYDGIGLSSSIEQLSLRSTLDDSTQQVEFINYQVTRSYPESVKATIETSTYATRTSVYDELPQSTKYETTYPDSVESSHYEVGRLPNTVESSHKTTECETSHRERANYEASYPETVKPLHKTTNDESSFPETGQTSHYRSEIESTATDDDQNSDIIPRTLTFSTFEKLIEYAGSQKIGESSRGSLRSSHSIDNQSGVNLEIIGKTVDDGKNIDEDTPTGSYNMFPESLTTNNTPSSTVNSDISKKPKIPGNLKIRESADSVSSASSSTNTGKQVSFSVNSPTYIAERKAKTSQVIEVDERSDYEFVKYIRQQQRKT